MREQTKEKIEAAKAKIAAGSTQAAALKEVGLTGATFRKYAKRRGPRKSTSTTLSNVRIASATWQDRVAEIVLETTLPVGAKVELMRAVYT